MSSTNPSPDHRQTLIPYLRVRGAASALEFYKKAFGAVEIIRVYVPGSETIMHASIRIGNSMLMLSDEFPQWKSFSPLSLNGTGSLVHINVDDVDKAFAQAVAAGAKVTMPVANMFWGDRYGKLIDPYGHEWSMATHVEEVSAEEMQQRAVTMFPKPQA